MTRCTVPVLAALLMLTGCTSDTATPETATSPSTSSGITPTAEPSEPHTPHDEVTPLEAPEADAGSQSSAISAAERAVDAFANPQLPYQEWIEGLYPLLTQAAATAYEGTDPANVPATQVIGTGQVLAGSTEVALIVQVPTDAGLYNVSLSRPGGDAPWLADRIRPSAS